MNARRSMGTRSRLLGGFLALVLLAAVASGCGDDDFDSTSQPLNRSTTTSPAPTPNALPDFIITNVSVEPSGPLVPPGQVQISATVMNVGAAGYAQRIVVQAPGNHTGGFNGLAAGASDIAVIDFPVVSPNVTITLSLVVDPDNVIAEESETNNESGVIEISTGP